MDYNLIISLIISLCLVLIVMPRWIRKTKEINFIWKDMNKPHNNDLETKWVSGSGGIVVCFSFIIGVLSYIAIRTFLIQTQENTIEIFALLTTILITLLVGFIDDVFGWERKGLAMRVRILLVMVAAIPLMVINAGVSFINIPLIGLIDVGILYAIFLIPLGVVGAATTYNFLAGFNGLEAGQGIIILSFLSMVAYLTDSSWLAVIGLCMVSSLIGFYYFNKVPAKVFPGDVLTYSIGALIAGMAILGNFEKIAVFVFIPYIFEVIFKVRGKLKKHSFGKVLEDGSLEMPYDKIYGLEHFSIYFLKNFIKKKKVYEKDVVYFIFSIQILICIFAVFIFKGALV